MSKDKIVFLDTSALIPFIDNSKDNHKTIFRYIENEKSILSIDTDVLSEYLFWFSSPEEQKEAKDSITRQFLVFSLTSKGSLIGAHLYAHLAKKGLIPKAKTEMKIFRVDLLILAAAVENRVDVFLYEDKHFSSMISALQDFHMPQYKIPLFQRIQDIQFQPELFENPLSH